MPQALRSPWTLSFVGHAAAIALLVWGFFNWLPPPPAVLRMHLAPAAAGSGPAAAPGTTRTALPSSPHTIKPADAGGNPWQTTALSTPAAPDLLGRASSHKSSLDELLAGTQTGASSETAVSSALPSPGWAKASNTDGHELPPLPPPSLIPPQGARWNLVFSVPAEGGFPTAIQGLGEGNPELDRWLETWLRDVTFPAAPGGGAYTLKWTLILEVGRPE